MSENIHGGGNRRVTLAQVAAVAHVSVSTASKALNDKGRVSVSTRLLVRDVAEQMGYLPVSDRRSSESYSSHLIGLITSDIGGRFSLPILAGAERTLGSKNHSVVLMNGYGDPETEQNRLETMVYTRLLDGIIVVSDDTKPREPIPLLRDMNLPVVYAYAPSLDPRDASIICDNLSAGQSAINEILSLGRTRIAVIGGDERFLASRERAAGVKQAMADAGLRLAAPIRFNDWTEQWGRRSMDMILASNPRVNAVYCMNDLLARGAIDSIEEHGLHVPEDVIVIGHDNWDIICMCRLPTITSFDNALDDIGKMAARIILRSSRGYKPVPGIIKLPCRIVRRQSTAI